MVLKIKFLKIKPSVLSGFQCLDIVSWRTFSTTFNRVNLTGLQSLIFPLRMIHLCCEVSSILSLLLCGSGVQLYKLLRQFTMLQFTWSHRLTRFSGFLCQHQPPLPWVVFPLPPDLLPGTEVCQVQD